MKIITFNVNKGGSGKTTLAHNFAEYLRRKYRILLIDFDDSANLTHRYGKFANQNTVVDLFEKGTVKPIKIKKNLDLIPGSREVEAMKERLTSRRRREYIFGNWLGNNIEELERNYDYIVIDTENDEGILTTNALLVSDLVLGVAEASKDSVTALARLTEFVGELNQDFQVNIINYFVANKINLSENASKDLLAALGEYDEYLGYLPRRTSLGTDESIFENEKKDPETLNQVSQLFDVIRKQLDKVGA